MEEERTKKPHVTITFAGATEDVEVFYVLVLKTWSEYASHLQRKFGNLKGGPHTIEMATNLILGALREPDRKNSFLPSVPPEPNSNSSVLRNLAPFLFGRLLETKKAIFEALLAPCRPRFLRLFARTVSMVLTFKVF